MREIKFRAWIEVIGEDSVFGPCDAHMAIQGEPDIETLDSFMNLYGNAKNLMQFTGHKINEVDVFEGDIIRLEENEDGVDPADQMTYYVVVWIKEWCMFATLRACDEYPDYLAKGVDGIEADMFWTFPLDTSDTTTSKHFLCGNIFDNPELLSLNTVNK